MRFDSCRPTPCLFNLTAHLKPTVKCTKDRFHISMSHRSWTQVTEIQLNLPFRAVSLTALLVHQLPEEKDDYEGEDEFEDNEEEEEANEQMRQILMRELGSNYVEDEMSDDEDDDFM